LTSLPRIEINPNPLVRVEQITEEFACVVIDDFLRNPGTIIDYCCEHADKFSIPERSYPGPLLSVSDDAMSDITRFIRSTLGKQFSFLKGGMTTSTFLSMVTLQPERLSNLQRLCHTDPRQRADRHNFAGLVYLFTDERLGGTGFYRWKEREQITKATALDLEDPSAALAFLKKRFPTYNQPPRYMTESNEIADLLLSIPARFNRFIFYSGDLPHSASIAMPELLSEDFRQGRLTLNYFASVVPR
jgi:hypothetical protein